MQSIIILLNTPTPTKSLILALLALDLTPLAKVYKLHFDKEKKRKKKNVWISLQDNETHEFKPFSFHPFNKVVQQKEKSGGLGF